jgi:hypothetical protein
MLKQFNRHNTGTV